MSSKSRILASLALVLALFSLAACDSKIGEEPPPPKAQEFSGTQCLSEAKPAVKDFIQGTASDRDVAATWDCISGAIEKFRRYVRGGTADRYTTQELATFLERNFLDGAKITPELQNQFMKIKQVFIGGGSEYITRVELEKVGVLLKNLKDISLRLNPYMKVLSLNWKVSSSARSQKDVAYFEEANREIQNAAKSLASLIEVNGQSYVLSDFIVLMREMSVLFEEQWTFPDTIQTYLPIVKKVKRALAGGDESAIAPNEWRRFTLLGARGYVQFMRYHYFIYSVPETGTGYRLSYLARTVEDLLSVFQDLVAEKPGGVISREEITELLNTFEIVWPDFKVSEKLVFEGMKIKQLFFGGSVDSLSTLDFETARLKVSRIKDLVERFLPYYIIYGQEWDPEVYGPDEAQKFFFESQFVLESTVREAGSLFEGTYDLNDFKEIIQEIERLYPPEDGEGYQQQVESYLPLVIDVKNIILGGTDSSLRKSNWSVLLSFAGRFYADYLYHVYFIEGHEFKDSRTVSSWSVFTNQTFNIFRDLLMFKKEGQISKNEITLIMQHLDRLKVLPSAITPESLDKLIHVTLNNFLVTPEDRLSNKLPNALNLASIEVARKETQIWLDTALAISEITAGWSSEKGMKPQEFLTLLKKMSKETPEDAVVKTGLTELTLLVDAPIALTVDQRSHVIISGKAQSLYTRKSMQQQNLNRALSRVLIRSFAGDINRINSYSGAILPEVQSGFDSLKPIFVAMGLLDKDNMTFASSRFMEANIFTPHSDGNSTASFAEISDLVGMIWSGLSINNLIRQDVDKRCFAPNEVITGKSLVSVACVRSSYRENAAQVLSATPDYLAFTQKVSKDEWAYFMNNIFVAAGYVPNSKGMAKVEDISLTPHVIQYIEMIFNRFDNNRDGFISTEEGIRAFPTFKGILMDLAADQLKSGKLKEKDLLDLFTYILRYGKPPETLLEQARFMFLWRGRPESWGVWADRVQLSQIMAYIAKQTAKSKSFMPDPAPIETLEAIAGRL